MKKGFVENVCISYSTYNQILEVAKKLFSMLRFSAKKHLQDILIHEKNIGYAHSILDL